jgi:subtilisin family serine protease
VGCGGGGGGGSSVSSGDSGATQVTFDRMGAGVSGSFLFSREIPSGVSESYEITDIEANKCASTASISSATFTLTSTVKSATVPFTVAFTKPCISDKITIKYNRIGSTGAKFPYEETITNPDYNQSNVTVNAGTDPLYQQQWHLKNTGQTVGVSSPATAGEDIDVEGVWSIDKVTGKGVVVAVIDEGVDMFHPDLKDNLLFDYSYNYHTASNNPTPIRAYKSDGGGYYDFPHGTAVAGLIGAKGWNGIGTRGVAPDSSLISFNALEVFANEAQTLYTNHEIPNLLSNSELQLHRLNDALVRNIEIVDIYSNSLGSSIISLESDYPTYLDFDNQLKYGVTNGRNGKGSIYVKSAGNGRRSCADENVTICDMDNFEQMQTNGYFVVVGASGADGTYSHYSTPGSNILVNAPGGGETSYYLKPDEQMIVTTDLVGKARGYDATIPTETSVSHFNISGNENYDYTQIMNGTSAAAPIVSGVVSLMLEANPNLTWRDVKIILARTASKNDALNSGWKNNAAGLHFNNNYGFGRVNAEAAIAMAKNFVSVGKTGEQTIYETLSFSDLNSASGVLSTSLNIPTSIAIEHVQIVLTLKEAPTQYLNYNYNGSGSPVFGPLNLYGGSNIFNLITYGDENQSTSVSLADNNLLNNSSAIFSGIMGNAMGYATETATVDLNQSGAYYLGIESNASSWSVSINSPLPKMTTPKLKISLRSPSNTESVLVDAPNGLSESDEYNETRLSSVQFMDEQSNGNWTLRIEDVDGGSFTLDKWEIQVRGH